MCCTGPSYNAAFNWAVDLVHCELSDPLAVDVVLIAVVVDAVDGCYGGCYGWMLWMLNAILLLYYIRQSWRRFLPLTPKLLA